MRIRTRALSILVAGALALPVAVMAPVATAADEPNDPLFQGSDFIGEHSWGMDQIRVLSAWDVTRGDGAVVAVVDTGVDLTHPDLAANLVPGATFWDCPTDDVANTIPCGDGSWDDPDKPNTTGDTTPPGQEVLSDHGTHVAGTVAAIDDNGIGVYGAAPNAKIMPVRVLDDNGGAFEEIAAGIRWATANGADVINMSLGAGPGIQALTITGVFAEAREAVAEAVAAGVVVVAAAGNDSVLPCGTPAWEPGALCVISTDAAEARSWFSNGGVQENVLDIVAAPGGQGTFCDPSLAVLSTVATTLAPSCSQPSGYGTKNGTSMASPHVAGVAALLVAAGCTGPQTFDLLKDTARQPQTDQRGVFTPTFGYGIVDAAEGMRVARQAATPLCTPIVNENNPPVAEDDTASGVEDNDVIVDVLDNDSDPDGDTIGVVLATSGLKGTTTVNGNGTVTYTPFPDTFGQDTFTYTISDGRDGSDTATVTVDIVNVNDDPTALDDAAVIDADTTEVVDVTANDVEPDGDTLAITSVAGGAGSANVVAGGVEFTTPADFAGKYTQWSYTVDDGNGATSQALVDIVSPGCLTTEVDDFDAEQDGWTTDSVSAGAPTWTAAPDDQNPAGNSWQILDGPDTADERLVSPAFGVGSLTGFEFVHRHDFETGSYDGGVLELTTDAGASWVDLGPFITSGGYNGEINDEFGNPLGLRPAWVEASTGGATFTAVTVDLRSFVGETVQVRWRFGADGLGGLPAQGWAVDDVSITNIFDPSCELVTGDGDPFVVTTVTPGCVVEEDQITIEGTGFGATQGASTAVLAGSPIQVDSWSDTTVVATVPTGASSGFAGVVIGGVTSNGKFVEVVTGDDPNAGPPSLSDMTPTSGEAGTIVTFTGSGFGTVAGCGDGVVFAGSLLPRDAIQSWSDTEVVVETTPEVVNGFAGIVVHGVASNGIYYQAGEPPVVETAGPSPIAPDEELTITGTGFGDAPDEDSYPVLDGQQLAVVSWSATEVVATVPAGASTGYAGIVRDGLTSNGVFVVVDDGTGPQLDAIDPTSGPVGTRVTFTGSNFGDGTGPDDHVVFNGQVVDGAGIESWSDTEVVAFVPIGATDGYAGVVVDDVVSNGKFFTVTGDARNLPA